LSAATEAFTRSVVDVPSGYLRGRPMAQATVISGSTRWSSVCIAP
jgi:hypothetical protein